jgi:hypothetical protein
VAVLKSAFNKRIRYSVIGVFPVPPVARLPTQMMGKLNAADFKIFLSNNLLRNHIMPPYSQLNGKRRYLKLFRSKVV